jgi:hypothetical protein
MARQHAPRKRALRRGTSEQPHGPGTQVKGAGKRSLVEAMKPAARLVEATARLIDALSKIFWVQRF